MSASTRAGCKCLRSNGWIRGPSHPVPCPTPGHADRHPERPDPATEWNITDMGVENPMTGACESCGVRVALIDTYPIRGVRYCVPCGARDEEVP